MSGKNKNKKQYASPGNHDAPQKENTNRHVYIEPGAKIDFVQNLIDKYDAVQKGNTTHSNKILFWTKISALLLFVYAGLTFWQARETDKAAGAAKSAAKTASDALIDSQASFELQNRPYVIVPTKAAFVHDNNGHFIWTAANIDYKNVGKTPAQDVVTVSHFSLLKPGITQKSWAEVISMFEDAYKTIPEQEAEIFKPGFQPQEIDMAPDAPPTFSTQELSGSLSKSDELGLRDGSVILMYFGRFYYKGYERKKSYSTDFCFYFFGHNPEIWHYCPIHNTLK